MKLKFVIYKDAANEYRWRLIAKNGRIVADSGEGYSTHYKAKRAFNRLYIGLVTYGSPTTLA